MTLASKKLTRIESELLADLLMGAAYADNNLENSEQAIVLKIMQEMTSQRMLPASLMSHISAFNPKAFNLDKTLKAFGVKGGEEAKLLLGLLIRVTEADDVYDMDEGSYLMKVATAINAPKELTENLTMELLDEGDLEEIEIEL
ncbi:TerB family tellurite resistance protein [Myxococcota bacterium]|nr:TerB family tellurite resistance protein [Myxococcota bacterium]MBU1535050.1 TerB family tellurite resistance protein [Myxococcota bacterium]